MAEQEHLVYFRDASIAHKNTRYIEIVHDEIVNDQVVQLNDVCWLHILANFEKPVPVGQWTVKLVVKVDRYHAVDSMSPLIKILAKPTAKANSSSAKEEILELTELSGEFWDSVLHIDSEEGRAIGKPDSRIKVSKLQGDGSNDWYVLELMPFQLAADSFLTLEWDDKRTGHWKSGISWYTADLIPYQPYRLSVPRPRILGGLARCGEVQWVFATTLGFGEIQTDSTSNISHAPISILADGNWMAVEGQQAKHDDDNDVIKFNFSVKAELLKGDVSHAGQSSHSSKGDLGRCRLGIKFPPETLVRLGGSELLVTMSQHEKSSDDYMLDLEREMILEMEIDDVSSRTTDLSIKCVTLYDNPLEFDREENEHFSDFVIRSGDISFKCHKAVLATRSQFFAAMLRHPHCLESQKNEVEIAEQFDRQTIEKFLEFVYNGKLKNPAIACTQNLFEIADMYDVPGLRALCNIYLT